MSHKEFLILFLLFVSSRVLYLAMGVHFDATTLQTSLQFIDPELLKHRLIESLTFFHSKPPLLNFIAGLGLKIFGDHAILLFEAIFHLLGLLIAVSVFYLLDQLVKIKPVTWLITIMLLFNPSLVLYENWFMYTWLSCALLTGSAALLYKYLSSNSIAWGLGFFVCAAALVMSRAIFHFYWLILVVVILFIFANVSKKHLLQIACLPILICFMWYAKNYYLLGTFSSSTLLGLSMSNITTLAIPRPVLQQHVDNGELSRFATVSRYRDLPKILNEESLTPKVGIPVLDEEKYSNGRRNYNSLEIKLVGEHYLADAIKVVQRYPGAYVTAVGIANRIFASPGSMSPYFSEANRKAVAPIDRIYNPVLYGSFREGSVSQPHFGYGHSWKLPVNTGYTLIMFGILVAFWSSFQAATTILTNQWTARNIVIGFIFGCLLLLYLSGTLLELAENNRYRVVGEPLFWVLVALAFSDIFKRIGNQWVKRMGQ